MHWLKLYPFSNFQKRLFWCDDRDYFNWWVIITAGCVCWSWVETLDWEFFQTDRRSRWWTESFQRVESPGLSCEADFPATRCCAAQLPLPPLLNCAGDPTSSRADDNEKELVLEPNNTRLFSAKLLVLLSYTAKKMLRLDGNWHNGHDSVCADARELAGVALRLFFVASIGGNVSCVEALVCIKADVLHGNM